jgi:hypothetical protein
VALSLERGFGLSYYSESEEQMDVTQTNSTTNLGLGLGFALDSPSIVRVGVDYIMVGGLSLGGALGYASISRSSEVEGGGVSAESDGPTFSALVLGPRVGYVLPLTDSLDLWPRGGITYDSLTTESTTIDLMGGETTVESSTSDVFLTVEVPLLVLAAPNFGFLIAPTLDYAISRSEEFDGTENEADLSAMGVGLRFGVTGVL